MALTNKISQVNPEKLDHIRQALHESVDSMRRTAESAQLQEQLYAASEAIKNAYINGGSLYIAGNGGSAADAQHFSAELVAKLCRDRTPIKSMSMTTDTSLLTAIGNDFGYDHIFSRQVEGMMSKHDVFFGITTSGNSKNILNALEQCRKQGITSILLTGETGGKCRALATHAITVPGTDTRLVQESHSAIYHTLCSLLEQDLVKAGVCQYRSEGRVGP